MSLLVRQSYDVGKLAKEFPGEYKNSNKKAIFELCVTSSNPLKGTIVFSRWGEAKDKPSFPTKTETKFSAQQDGFTYPAGKETNPPTVEWYVNFADAALFFAYGGSLLAQDELMAAEHPALGPLREVLRAAMHKENGTELQPFTRKEHGGTPCLVRGVERRCFLDTSANSSEGRPNGLYGNAFGRASTDTVKKAVKLLNPTTYTNIIAMAALGYGRGAYTTDQINDTLNTAYTSFHAAKMESWDLCGYDGKSSSSSSNSGSSGSSGGEKKDDGSSKNASPRVVVHTGNWGSGAFGGDPVLMTLIQMIAGRLAGVDELRFHTFDKRGTDAFATAQQLYDKQFVGAGKSLSFGVIIMTLEKMGFKWGISNGT